MELIAVIFMIAAGVALAIGLAVIIGVATRNAEEARGRAAARDRSHIAASILFNILIAGGAAPDEALREVRRRAGLGAPVTEAVDIGSWGARFAEATSEQQRRWLLETAVQLIAGRERAVPLRQYAALLDLSFALGFQTDALAKLREQYGFDYIDHARDARPQSADRSGGATPLFVRDTREPGELLRLLGIEGAPTRQIIISAYRRMATQHHPDKLFGVTAEVQAASIERFIEITRAYETLLSIYRD